MCISARETELACIREMIKEYKSMPSIINGERNWAKTGLYHRIEMKMKACDMKDRHR